ncbi:hypothetical protein L291_2614 [Acinetobacter guillouiae MSP4-18]|nr:hypothetical protein L291_2614 [Acinetobacter guillouiae MSP4-18]BAP35553.1 hypothetical protein AS4_06130 [Acinetobacter guillouiae]
MIEMSFFILKINRIMAEFLFKFPHGDLGDMFRVKYTQSP